jgi:hypothetical protein
MVGFSQSFQANHHGYKKKGRIPVRPSAQLDGQVYRTRLLIIHCPDALSSIMLPLVDPIGNSRRTRRVKLRRPFALNHGDHSLGLGFTVVVQSRILLVSELHWVRHVSCMTKGRNQPWRWLLSLPFLKCVDVHFPVSWRVVEVINIPLLTETTRAKLGRCNEPVCATFPWCLGVENSEVSDSRVTTSKLQTVLQVHALEFTLLFTRVGIYSWRILKFQLSIGRVVSI